MIRQFERSPEHPGLSILAQGNGRIPIFAVSASLVESEKQKYVDAGFDGWILKPIDFKRLNTLLMGITDDETRQECLYEPGEWERGGWFGDRGDSKQQSEEDTTPTGKEGPAEILAPSGEAIAEAENVGDTPVSATAEGAITEPTVKASGDSTATEMSTANTPGTNTTGTDTPTEAEEVKDPQAST